MWPRKKHAPHLTVVRGGRLEVPARPSLRPGRVWQRRQRVSRNMKLLLGSPRGSLLYALGDGVSCAVGVNAREVIVCKARWFRAGSVTRHALRDVVAIEVHMGASACRMEVVLADSRQVILFWSSQSGDFAALAACIRRGMTGRLRPQYHSPTLSVGRQRIALLRAIPSS